MPPAAEGVSVSLRSERIVFSLPELERQASRRPSTVRPPRVSAPELEGRFKLRPMRLFALRELLHITRDARATARIPLVVTTLRKGPFSIDIPDDTELVIDLGVEDAHIVFDRDRTRGVIEPAIKLPLGLSFRGVNIKEDGSVVADVSKLPIDIAWIRFRKLRIPASLAEINEILEARDAAAAAGQDNDDEGGLALPLDYSRIVVLARDLIPRAQVFPLGEAGEVELFESSLIDVDYDPDTLSIRGHLAARGDLSGSGFIAKDVQVDARASAELRRPKGHTKGTAVEVGCERITAAEGAITLLDGSLFELRDVAVEGLHVWARRLAGVLDWKVACKRIRASLDSGMLMVWIGGRAHELHFGETVVEGSFNLGSHGYEVDLEIEGAVLRAGPVRLDIGAADLEFHELQASASGRLKYNSETGVDFDGVLSVNGDLAEGWLWAGPLRAHLLGETTASLNITEIKAGPKGIESIVGTGTAELQLASGSIPIGRTAELAFSRGAQGTVAIHQAEMREGMRWPKIEAGARLTAQSDELDLGGLTLPAGLTNVEVARIEVDPAGTLSLGEIEIAMQSDGDEAAVEEDLETTMDLAEDEVPETYESVEVDEPGGVEA
jgi:hypothetical protein